MNEWRGMSECSLGWLYSDFTLEQPPNHLSLSSTMEEPRARGCSHTVPWRRTQSRAGGLFLSSGCCDLCKSLAFFSVVAPGELRGKYLVAHSKFIRPHPLPWFLAPSYGPTLVCFPSGSSTTSSFFFFLNKIKIALLFSNYKNATCSY